MLSIYLCCLCFVVQESNFSEKFISRVKVVNDMLSLHQWKMINRTTCVAGVMKCESTMSGERFQLELVKQQKFSIPSVLAILYRWKSCFSHKPPITVGKI